MIILKLFITRKLIALIKIFFEAQPFSFQKNFFLINACTILTL